jgi:hypothetical protein
MIAAACGDSRRLKWSSSVVQHSLGKMVDEGQQLLKAKYLALLFVSTELEHQLPLSEYLLDISSHCE